jgi:hypothetical protein
MDNLTYLCLVHSYINCRGLSYFVIVGMYRLFLKIVTGEGLVARYGNGLEDLLALWKACAGALLDTDGYCKRCITKPDSALSFVHRLSFLCFCIHKEHREAPCSKVLDALGLAKEE